MRTIVGGAAAAALVLGALVVGPAQAAPETATGATPGVPTAVARFSMLDRYARETTHYGQSDASVNSIAHVRELQYRLRWVNTFNAGVTGYFGDITRAAVRHYQRREGLAVTGVATHETWRHLIRDTIRGRGAIPRGCKTAGWHACYDRARHQVTLWHGGVMRNSWLVRGGASSTPTRLGTHSVYYRDIDHRSHLFDGSPMPYSQFFDGGQALHGSGFMIDPFVDHSHGCVNMYIEDARQLWRQTSSRRLVVTVYGAWD